MIEILFRKIEKIKFLNNVNFYKNSKFNNFIILNF